MKREKEKGKMKKENGQRSKGTVYFLPILIY